MRASDVRLPGVSFLPPPRAAGPDLPPLDVAGFVGFAQRGPLDLPVPVEDPEEYRDVFGGDLPLARAAGGKTAYAHLPRAVADFFANGGRRCHVVRVAGPGARPARLRVPGLVAVGGPEGKAVSLSASSAGRWGAALRLATRLRITPLPRDAFAVADEHTLTWRTAGPTAVRAGDVLRLTFEESPVGGGVQWLFPVAGLRPPAEAGGAAAVAASDVWQLITDWASSPSAVSEVFRQTADGEAPLGAGGFLVGGGGARLTLSGSDSGQVQRGDVLRLVLGGASYLFPVEERAEAQSPSPLSQTLELRAGAMLRLEPVALPAGAFRRVERLRFDLLVRYEGRKALADFGFNAGHPRFWGEGVLLESSALSRGPGVGAAEPARAARRNGDETPLSASRAAQLFRLLGQDVRLDEGRHGRLDLVALSGLLAPLAEEEAARTYLPLGMPAVLGEGDLPGPPAEDPGDDGLAFHEAGADGRCGGDPETGPGCRFAGVFLDPYLSPLPLNPAAGESARTLLAAGFDRYYLQNRRLHGLHALLVVEEVALASVPDAVQRLWQQGEPPEAPQPPAPPPAPPPLPPYPESPFLPCSPAQQQKPAAEPPPAPATPSDLPVVQATDEFSVGPLLAVQHALVTLCQARADAVAVLTLPRHFETPQCIEWQEALRRKLGLPPRGRALGEGGFAADLSYAAVYHPWLLQLDADAPDRLRAVPCDGAICGMIAARERQRRVWVAPANVPLRGVLGLTPALATADWEELFDRQFNLVRQEPLDFRAMSAHTLSLERPLLQLSVRRLMILLRKVATERGTDYVFESNHERFRDGVRVALEDLLRSLFEDGAFAGATPEQSYRVLTDAGLNPPQSIDQGRFVAEIRVAPSQPAEFITVQLIRTSDGQLQAAGG